MNTRREFLIKAPIAMASVAAACRGSDQPAATVDGTVSLTPGTPPAFGTSAGAGPVVSASDFEAAEKLAQLSYTAEERAMLAESWRRTLSSTLERRVGPRVVPIPPELSPASIWNPAQAVSFVAPTRDRFVRSVGESVPPPASDDDIAFAPVTSLSRWIERRQLSCDRLTQIYLDRIAKYDPQLRCIITLTRDRALTRARAADAEIAAGKYRGPLHGIPFGVKDLLDTAGIATTYGAEPYRDRVPERDSAVVKRLEEAGAILIAKLSLGALALNDIWFGGQTMNPWLLEEGALY